MTKDKPVEVIFDAIPNEYALLARQEFINAEYDKISQERKNYYSRDFYEKSQFIPDHNEIYYSEFHRSKFLEENLIIKECYTSYIKPLVELRSGKKVINDDIRCYKMERGGHFRVHKDTYKSDIGFVWYLSKEWKWDWGGLLLTITSDQNAEVTIPRFNQLVIMDHKYSQIPHSVTPVTSYANEPRIMLVGFLQTES